VTWNSGLLTGIENWQSAVGILVMAIGVPVAFILLAEWMGRWR
jgi:hypothetical protein